MNLLVIVFATVLTVGVLAELSNKKLLQICNNKNLTVCDQMYFYKQKSTNFLSARNVTLSFNSGTENVVSGKILRVVIHNMLPYVTYNKTTKQLDGYLGTIWNILMENLKFKSTVEIATYDDALLMLQNGSCDILLAAAVLKDGLINVDYSQPYFYNWYHLYYRQPRARAQSFSYLRTLNDELWIASVIMFIALAFGIWGTVKISQKYVLQYLEVQVPVFNCLLTAVSGFINQGFDINVQCLSARVLVFFALIFGTMLYLSMNAVLVAQLAIFEIDSPFKSLEDLSVQRSHSLCLRTDSFVYNNFTKVHSERNKTILPKWKNIINGPGCPDIVVQSNIPKIICDERIVILENRAVMSAVTKKYKIPCTITHRPERLFRRSNHFLLSKSLQGKKIIEYLLKKMKSTGILFRMENQWVPDQTSGNSAGIQIPQVTMEHISGIMMVLVIWMPIAAMILFVERIYNRNTVAFEFIK